MQIQEGWFFSLLNLLSHTQNLNVCIWHTDLSTHSHIVEMFLWNCIPLRSSSNSNALHFLEQNYPFEWVDLTEMGWWVDFIKTVYFSEVIFPRASWLRVCWLPSYNHVQAKIVLLCTIGYFFVHRTKFPCKLKLPLQTKQPIWLKQMNSYAAAHISLLALLHPKGLVVPPLVELC